MPSHRLGHGLAYSTLQTFAYSSMRRSLCIILASLGLVSYPNLSNANNVARKAGHLGKNSEPAVKPRRVFKSTDEIVTLYGSRVREKLKPLFRAQAVAYPPPEMTWVALKQEKVLLLFAKDKNGRQKQVLSYCIIGQSGASGPKLKEGDMQVPEGFYRMPSFHPNVVAHMAIDVNYPNDEDRAHAISEGRKKLGCDILIHGSRWSSGCLAMGNVPIEEMYVLAYDCGLKNIKLIFAPCNLLNRKPQVDFKKQPIWLPRLYQRIADALKQYPIDTSSVPAAESPEETKATY